MRVVRVLRLAWIPLVVLTVIGCGGFPMSRVQGVFGTEDGSDSIGCRVVVDGVVKAERVPNDVNAYTHCLVKAA